MALNVKALVGNFNQKNALVVAFFVIVKSSRNLWEPPFEALVGGRDEEGRKVLGGAGDMLSQNWFCF